MLCYPRISHFIQVCGYGFKHYTALADLLDAIEGFQKDGLLSQNHPKLSSHFRPRSFVQRLPSNYGQRSLD